VAPRRRATSARKRYYIGYRDPVTGRRTKALDAQAAFHASLAPNRAYIGGMGSGKTACGCVEALSLSMMYPNNFGLVGRVSLPELEHTTKKTFLEEIIDPELMADSRFFKGKNLLVLPNGSQVLFTHLLNPMRFRSMQLGYYWLDEAIEAGCDEAHDELKKRLRLPGVGRRCAFFTSNPGAETSYLFQSFCNRSWFRRKQYEVFNASSLDNPHLPNDYLERLHDMSDEDYQTYVLGKWIRSRGRIFDTFDRRVHVIEPFPIPDHWLRFRSMDFGIAHQMVCGWWTIDEEDGRLIQYREWAATDQSLPDFVETVKGLDEGEQVAYSVIDPSAKARSIQTGVSTFDQLATMGMKPVLGDNDVASSIRRINSLLRFNMALSGEFVRKPKAFWFDTCQQTIEQIERYQWEVTRGKTTGKPLKKNDDCVDQMRYAVQSAVQVQPEMYADLEDRRQPTRAQQAIAMMARENERKKLQKEGYFPFMARGAPRFRRRTRPLRVRRIA